MDPLQSVQEQTSWKEAFCPNMDCPARGHTGRGNIRIHCHKRKRLRCTVCKRTFSHRTETPFLHAKTSADTMALVLTLIAFGCPVVAIEAAFHVQRRTVRQWVEKGGRHTKRVHEDLVLQEQALEHVQVDELFARSQQGATRTGSRHRWRYVFSAICVPTRLWLGGVVSTKRDAVSARDLAMMVSKAALPVPLLVVSDGFKGYVNALWRAFRSPVHTGRAGRPRLVVSQALLLVQQVKHSQRVDLALGTLTALTAHWLKLDVSGTGVVATSYIERLNATFRERLAPLARRTRHLSRTKASLEAGLYLVGTVYNFCCVHRSLGRTPAMAAGLTNAAWSVERLLWHRVAPPQWRPPVHRGPLSNREKALLAQWGT